MATPDSYVGNSFPIESTKQLHDAPSSAACSFSFSIDNRKFLLQTFFTIFFLFASSRGVLTAQQLDPQAVQQIIQLKNNFQNALDTGKVDDAIRLGEEMGRIAERAFAGNPDTLAAILSNVAQAYELGGQAEIAVTVHRRVLELFRRTQGESSQFYLMSLNNLATGLATLGNFAESEGLFLQAVQKAEALKLTPNPFVSKPLSNLARMYYQQQRFTEAEKACKRALEIWLKDSVPNQTEIAISWLTLADVYSRQKRPSEAETSYQRALAAVETGWGKDHFQICRTLGQLGFFYLGQHRPADAKPVLERLLAIQERVAPQSMDTAQTVYWLAMVYTFDQRRTVEAQQLLDKARRIYEKSGVENAEFASQLSLGIMGIDSVKLLESMNSNTGFPTNSAEEALRLVTIADQSLGEAELAYGGQDPRILENLLICAHWRVVLGELELSEKLISHGFDIVASNPVLVPPADKLSLFESRAAWHTKKGNSKDAIMDLNQAIAIAETLRWNAAGTDQDRAKYATQFIKLYDDLALLQAKNGQIVDAFHSLEAARNRILLNQMESQSVDILAGIPPAQAQQLRQVRLAAQNRILQLEVESSRVSLDKSRTEFEIATATKRITDELEQARQKFLAIQREIYNASPTNQLAPQSNRQAATLETVQAWCSETNTLLLEYLVHENESFVLIVSPHAATQIVTLTVTESDAETLETKPNNPWNDFLVTSLAAQDALSQALANKSETGVMQMLQRPSTAIKATAKLKALANILLPPSVRAMLDPAKHQHVVVIPDGPLVDLPFEVLVLAGEETPEYVLDTCPPVSYAPSTNVLLSLAQRPISKNWQSLPVLSVANPQYAPTSVTATSPLSGLSPRTRLAGAGKTLPALPHSGLESTWFLDVFKREGKQGESLLQKESTEANVRKKIAGRSIVHFACHGFVDRNQGNLLGSLALTPGIDARTNPENDGFLTLSEIYELDLRGSELVVLSACESNLGPQQRGEGSWALSRGFLVAGARRVVATNWLVDDEAAASLVSYFGSSLAVAEKKAGKADVSKALFDARRWVRQQEKWRSPYFWGNFVLLGPF